MKKLLDRAFGNAYLVLVVAPVLWGGNAVAGRFAVGQWEPFTITSVRWLCAMLLLLPFAWGPLRKDWPVIKRHWLILFLLGSLGMGPRKLAARPCEIPKLYSSVTTNSSPSGPPVLVNARRLQSEDAKTSASTSLHAICTDLGEIE